MDKWISVKDRLPDEEFRKWVKDCTDNDPDINEIEALEVIVLIKGASAATTLFYCDGDFFDGDANLYNVTHWMPLPEPPKGNADND